MMNDDAILVADAGIAGEFWTAQRVDGREELGVVKFPRAGVGEFRLVDGAIAVFVKLPQEEVVLVDRAVIVVIPVPGGQGFGIFDGTVFADAVVQASVIFFQEVVEVIDLGFQRGGQVAKVAQRNQRGHALRGHHGDIAFHEHIAADLDGDFAGHGKADFFVDEEFHRDGALGIFVLPGAGDDEIAAVGGVLGDVDLEFSGSFIGADPGTEQVVVDELCGTLFDEKKCVEVGADRGADGRPEVVGHVGSDFAQQGLGSGHFGEAELNPAQA